MDEFCIVTNDQIADQFIQKGMSSVDIKSKGLRDILRVVLEGVHRSSLREADQPRSTRIEAELYYT